MNKITHTSWHNIKIEKSINLYTKQHKWKQQPGTEIKQENAWLGGKCDPLGIMQMAKIL